MGNKQDIEEVVKEAKTVRKIVFYVLMALTLVFITGIIAAFFYVKSTIKPVDEKSDEEITIEIPLGSSTSNIATILKDKGLVKNSKAFQFYVKFKNYSDFQAGE